MINENNWNYTQYQTKQLKVFISLGAQLSAEDEFENIYFVTGTNHDYEELFQYEFSQLPNALQFINLKYAHYQTFDMRAPSGEGCGSCSAH